MLNPINLLSNHVDARAREDTLAPVRPRRGSAAVVAPFAVLVVACGLAAGGLGCGAGHVSGASAGSGGSSATGGTTAGDGGAAGGAGGTTGGSGGATGGGGGAVGAAGQTGAGGRAAGGNTGTGGTAGAAAFDVTATIDTSTRHQTMLGFGAAIVYYSSYLADRSVANDDIYQVLFADLGLDVLRIANWYQNQTETGGTTSTAFSDTAIAKVIRGATAALGGQPPKILMSSWSPPSYLKSNGDTKNGGTLPRANGTYQYAQFGQWWVNALNAYATNATNPVRPDFISIQNEPDFTATWESCRFDATEGATNAGYPQALSAVYTAIAGSNLNPKPQIWGGEPSGIADNKVQSYMAGVNANQVAGIAHHLYNGGGTGDDPQPDSFNATLAAVAGAAAGKPLYMTEYSPTSPSMFNTAWLIHNAVAVEGVAAYVYWEAIWPPPTTGVPTALVTVENPGAAFQTAKGYTINDIYYALKHFARWVDAGWIRVGATSTSTPVKVSAFVSPDGRSLTAVLLNTATTAHVVKLAPAGFAFTTSAAYRTSGTAERTTPIALGAGPTITLPATSIATVTFGP